MIALSNVCMEYRRGIQVLNNISLHVKSGEIFTLLGPNGAGKTTLIKILSTLILPTKGNILIDNKNIFHETHNIRKSISCVSQNTSIDDFLTVKENMVFQGKLYGINKKEINSRINQLLELLELNRYINYPISTLSGGIRRRVDIAVNMIPYPKILFLDEPTTGMDVSSRNKLWNGIKKMREQLNTTIILTTHYLEEAEKLSDTICIINAGEIVSQGSVDDLKSIFDRKKIVLCLLDKDEEILRMLGNKYDIKHEKGMIEIVSETPKIDIIEISKLFCNKGCSFSSISIRDYSLEDVFLFYIKEEVKIGYN